LLEEEIDKYHNEFTSNRLGDHCRIFSAVGVDFGLDQSVDEIRIWISIF